MGTLRDERGFTLVELLTALTLGALVLLGTLALLDSSIRLQGDTVERLETVQRGRLAMELVTQQLRSQVCLSEERPALVSAQPTRVEFHAMLATPGLAGAPRIQKRVLELAASPRAAGRQALWESVSDGVGTSRATTQFPAAPTRKVLVDDVEPIGGRLFRYFGFAGTEPATPSRDLGDTVAPDDLARTVQIEVGFRTRPQGGDARLAATLVNKVFVRTADPLDPDRSPKCV